MSAESGLFDIIAHADLCKKFCFYPKEDCTHLFTRLLEATRRRGLAMELNTADAHGSMRSRPASGRPTSSDTMVT